MKCKSVILLFLFVVCSMQTAFSQGKTVEITVMERVDMNDKKGALKGNVEVFGFYDLPKAVKFKRFLGNVGYVPKESDYDCYERTNNEGFCEMILPPSTGVVVVRPEIGDPVLMELRDKLSVTVRYVQGKVMKGVETVARSQRKRNRPVPARRFGNRKRLGPFSFYLNRDETRSEARMVLAPISTVIETGDTFMIAAPFVKDGKEFHKAQVRRMGFDETRDELSPYRDDEFMENNQLDSITVMLELYPLERGKHYMVNATKCFSNFYRIYVSDSVCLDEGYDKNQMRFLDYSLMQQPIEKERYVRRGRRELMNDNRKLDLKFMVGRAELDQTDSLNFLQLNQLKEDLGRYVFDQDASVTSIEIHGQASPDGGIAINERLCRQRAEFLKSEIAGTYPSLRSGMKASASVAGWDQVAQLLEEDSLVDYAGELRSIIASNKNTLVQERKIRALPYYDLIRERILPKLRVVDFTFYYTTNRVRTREEVYEMYQKDPEYKSGKKLKPYEFYYLFDMVKEPKELEVLAKAALKSVRDVDNVRPWPLPAYILSQCYLQRDTCDTTLLKPYLDWKRAGYAVPEVEKKGMEGNSLGFVNDEAIVTSHISQLCKSEDYFMADSVAVNLLPDTQKYRTLKLFLDCLNGGWNDPDVRDTVAASSEWNKMIVYAAQDGNPGDDRLFHSRALDMLMKDTVNFNRKDPRVHYMIATLRFMMDANPLQENYPQMHFEYDEYFMPSEDNPMVDDMGFKREDWGYPMVQCCQLDESYVKIALDDGMFNKAYRKAFKKIWEQLKKQPAVP